jgi:hypothetical protein
MAQGGCPNFKAKKINENIFIYLSARAYTGQDNEHKDKQLFGPADNTLDKSALY